MTVQWIGALSGFQRNRRTGDEAKTRKVQNACMRKVRETMYRYLGKLPMRRGCPSMARCCVGYVGRVSGRVLTLAG